METDAILGCIVLAFSLGLITYLTFWGRRTIDRIASKGLSTAREIVKELGEAEGSEK